MAEGGLAAPMIVKEGWCTHMADMEFPYTLRKIVETMKRGERASTVIKASHIKENNEPFF